MKTTTFYKHTLLKVLLLACIGLCLQALSSCINPAKVRCTATFQDPLYQDCNITWRIVSQTGAPLRTGVAVGTTFEVPLEGLPPGQHTILVSDGYLEYNKHIIILQ